MASKSFPVVRGRMMRITKVDGCGNPVVGQGNSIVTEGFVSVALSSNVTEAESIVVTNANGKACVRDPGTPSFDGYGVEITFCEVEPCLFALITGQKSLLNGADEVGFTMNSKRFSSTGFALEVWTGVPGGDACGPGGGASAGDPAGYFVLPNIQGGVLGDFTIENAAITFGITGASTRDGNKWGLGPYKGAFDVNAADGINNPANAGPYLTSALDQYDHLAVQFTDKGVPSITDGCVPLAAFAKTGMPDPAGITVSASAKFDQDVTVTIARNAPAGLPATGPVDVHWGDGSSDTITGTTLTATHKYATAGDYEISILTADTVKDFVKTYTATP